MIFNSLEFAIFLPLVFLIYWFVLGRMRKAQNGFLVIASYVFLLGIFFWRKVREERIWAEYMGEKGGCYGFAAVLVNQLVTRKTAQP